MNGGMAMKTGSVLIVALMFLVPFPVNAGRLLREATDAALVPVAEDDPAKAVLRLDLSEVPRGARLAGVFLEGTMKDLPADGSLWLAAYPIQGDWDQREVRSGREEVAADEEPAATWGISPLDHERNGGFVRLDLTDLARSWRGGVQANYGVMIVAEGIDAEVLQAGLAGLKLVLLYSE